MMIKRSLPVNFITVTALVSILQFSTTVQISQALTRHPSSLDTFFNMQKNFLLSLYIQRQQLATFIVTLRMTIYLLVNSSA